MLNQNTENVLAEAFFSIVTGTEEEIKRSVDAIEKMLDTVSGSTERETAKQELLNALLRK